MRKLVDEGLARELTLYHTVTLMRPHILIHNAFVRGVNTMTKAEVEEKAANKASRFASVVMPAEDPFLEAQFCSVHPPTMIRRGVTSAWDSVGAPHRDQVEEKDYYAKIVTSKSYPSEESNNPYPLQG